MLSKPSAPTADAAPLDGAPAARRGVRAWTLSSPDRSALARVVAAFVLTRVILYVTGALAIRMAPTSTWARVDVGKNLSLIPWIGWDAAWYVSIAQRGYSFDPHGPSNVAFFPVFPLLIKVVAAVTGSVVVAGLVVANLAALGAVLALWRWVRAEAGPAAAERSALGLLVYPFSFFLNSIYAESLFFLLVTLALEASMRGRRLTAGLWGALAATTRPMGVLLAPALAWGLWADWRAGRRVTAGDAVAVALPAAGLGVYMAYLWVAVGDPLAFWTAHIVGWNVQLQSSVAKYWRETYWVLTRLVRIHTYSHLLDTMRIVLPVVFVALTVSVFRRLGAVPGIYAALAVVVSVLFAIESVGREFLAVVPVFAVMGVIRFCVVLGEALRFFSMGLLLLLVFAFAGGRFVG